MSASVLPPLPVVTSVGWESLPAYLTQNLTTLHAPSLALTETPASLAAVTTTGPQNLTVSDLPGAAWRALNSLWSDAKQLKSVWDYYWYSKELQSQHQARHAPYELTRYVFDARGRAILPSPETLVRREDGPTSAVAAANRVYDYSGFIFKFFIEHLGFVLEQPLLQIVNYNDNASRYGFDNAYFNPIEYGLKVMVYGTGDMRHFKSFDSDITVIAHELAHNFVNGKHPGKFVGGYYGQAGALNEHVADVIAKCVEAKYNGWDDLVDHWFIGANLMVNPDFSLRDMAEPGSAYNDPELGKDPQPKHMKDFVVTEKDQGGVHINCGIMSRVFTLFCEALGGPIYETPLKVWLKAMELVKAEPTLFDFGQSLIVAASLFGKNNEMVAALQKVGVLSYVVEYGEVVKRG